MKIQHILSGVIIQGTLTPNSGNFSGKIISNPKRDKRFYTGQSIKTNARLFGSTYKVL